jgi:hypothetical protein
VRLDRFAAGDRAAVEELLRTADLPLEGFDPDPDRTVVARDGERVVGSATLVGYGRDALLRSVVVARTSVAGAWAGC